MKTLQAKMVAALILTGGLCACAPLSASQGSAPAGDARAAATAAAPSGAELIEGYRQWTRVNPAPALMVSRIADLCARPLDSRKAMEQARLESADPHRDKFVVVYVNDAGRRAMMEEKFPRFPQGSVIVKEKLPDKQSTSPELLTVMFKREPGYNPASGDWEYMVMDGAGKEVRERGRLETCQACHLMEKGTDYVSRNYLPYSVREKLK